MYHNVGQTALDIFQHGIGADWYDDYGWWGIAFAKAALNWKALGPNQSYQWKFLSAAQVLAF